MRNNGYKLGSTQKSLAILEAIADLGAANLTELAGRLELPKPTLLRHLRVLEQSGYVAAETEGKRYALGARLIYLGYEARRRLGLTDVALPVMRELRDRYEETVHVGVLSQADVLHVAVVPSRQPLKMATPIGERTFVHISALGKVLLAWSEPGAIDEVIRERGLPSFTERTLTDRETLESELGRIRKRGWAVDDEESSVGLRCIGAPIRDGSGRVTAAVSISAPSSRLTRAEARRTAPDLNVAAKRISAKLGYFDGVDRRGLVDSIGEDAGRDEGSHLTGAASA